MGPVVTWTFLPAGLSRLHRYELYEKADGVGQRGMGNRYVAVESQMSSPVLNIEPRNTRRGVRMSGAMFAVHAVPRKGFRIKLK